GNDVVVQAPAVWHRLGDARVQLAIEIDAAGNVGVAGEVHRVIVISVRAMLRAVLVDVTTWHLEMLEPSQLHAPEAPAGVELRQARRPTPELGRFLYTATGGNWYWFDRLPWTYDQWLDRLSSPRVETWVMYVDGTPA